MSNTFALAILFSAVFVSLIIIVGNIFTIFVFWKHRNRLRRTSFLLINLAVADLLVGITEPVALGTFKIPRRLGGPGFNSINYGNILLPLQTTFSCASVLFLVLISLERAYALIWPLRHRVASLKGYIYSVIFAWIAGSSIGTSIFLGVHGILNFVYSIVIFGCIVVLCLITVCVSYLAIRARLNHKISAFEGALQNRRNGPDLNAKFSRTLYVVAGASLLFWCPSIVLYCTHFLSSACLPPALIEVCNVLRLGNSLVNPIIYFFRISMFKETFKRMKLCKQ